VTRFPADAPAASGAPLALAFRELLGPDSFAPPRPRAWAAEPLPSSRAVYRFSFSAGLNPVVGKFFAAYPPETSLDQGLAREYDNYLKLPALGLNNGTVPRLLGRWPEAGLGLLLEAVPGPDLDRLLAQACRGGDPRLYPALTRLARLLGRFHGAAAAAEPVAPEPALAYLDKLLGQLNGAGLLNPEAQADLAREGGLWAARFADYPDGQVLVHGDATPTNFLFPDGRAVALDLERLRIADRLFDLSWVAGELKHAWGWRTGNFLAAEAAIRHFFGAYLEAAGAGASLARRIYHLNPFYMALAELRIARNPYLSLAYRRELVAEARRCLAGGRRLAGF
jgi:Ser/Thr protein kinase RdoA (MazF antagonist)